MQAGLEGRIHISLELATRKASVQVQRPLAAIQTLLVGKTLEEALACIPLLFSVCSQAQSFAALLAAYQALNEPPPKHIRHVQERIVQLETQREHVLRVLMDWSVWLGLTPNPTLIQQAMRIVPQARQAWFKNGKAFDLQSELLSDDLDILISWEAFLETHVFAMSLDEWSSLNNLRALQAWIDAQATPAAQTLAQLQQQNLAHLGANTFPLEQESSVLKRQAQQPLLQTALARYGSGVFTRYLARLVELVDTPPWQKDWVDAARGSLQHQIGLNAERRITRYTILAPTEVNFAANGVAAAGLQAILNRAQPDDLEAQARLWITAVDPCVAYDLELSDA